MEGASFLVRLEGLEPPTYWFVASHSIQLSYSRIPSIDSLIILAQGDKKCKTFFLVMGIFFERRSVLLKCKSVLSYCADCQFMVS